MSTEFPQLSCVAAFAVAIASTSTVALAQMRQPEPTPHGLRPTNPALSVTRVPTFSSAGFMSQVPINVTTAYLTPPPPGSSIVVRFHPRISLAGNRMELGPQSGASPPVATNQPPDPVPPAAPLPTPQQTINIRTPQVDVSTVFVVVTTIYIPHPSGTAHAIWNVTYTTITVKPPDPAPPAPKPREVAQDGMSTRPEPSFTRHPAP